MGALLFCVFSHDVWVSKQHDHISPAVGHVSAFCDVYGDTRCLLACVCVCV